MTELHPSIDPRLHAPVCAAAGDLWLTGARAATVIAQIAHRAHTERSQLAYRTVLHDRENAVPTSKENR